MHNISRLKNPIQEYAWGSRTAIPELLGLPVPWERPGAELWMGAHSSAPSQVFMDGGWQPLDQVIERDPISILGKAAARKFAYRLPFLFKMLAAECPLSIQVHPNLKQARTGFEREKRLGIPLNGTARSYRDSNHKPELLCAITGFEALKGFRPSEETARLLGDICHDVLAKEIALLEGVPEDTALRNFFASILSMERSRKGEVVGQAAARARRYEDRDPAFRWVAALHQAYPGDIGALSPLVLNLVTLEPGEAIYIPPGELHTYLKGVGMELMANSDNVIRGGLTEKHVNLPELLRVTAFRSAAIRKIRPRPMGAPAEAVYEAPAAEFRLSVITVSDGISFVSRADRTADILICMQGEARIQGLKGGGLDKLDKGTSVLVPAAAGPYRIDGEATLYRATVGDPP